MPYNKSKLTTSNRSKNFPNKKKHPASKRFKSSSKIPPKARRLHRNIPALRDLYTAASKVRKNMIKHASKDTVSALCDCASNISEGNVPLTTKQFKQLKTYHNKLKVLKNKSTSHKKKKQVLQTGGFIGALLQPIAQLLLGGIFKR